MGTVKYIKPDEEIGFEIIIEVLPSNEDINLTH